MPDILVLHYTAMADWQAARDWLCNPEAEVSAHYLISPLGDVVQLVEEDQRAWHAGAGSWGDVQDVNSRSIGIELSNDGASPFAAPLMNALDGLIRAIMDRWSIPPERVIAHSDLAPGRKIDPGPRFDWARLARAGLAVQGASSPGADAPNEDAFRRDMVAVGYNGEVSTEVLLSALRLRHRQGHDGPLDGVDCAIAADLAARFPVDRSSATA
ncbi:MAG: N-acetylmuramoyl-L-alanine amidase [Pseudomonadota bacterium]